MGSDRREGHLPGSGQAVYPISVAAELAGIEIHTLRLYEQHGLITPARSAGGTRRYSGDDLARLQRITALTRQGSICRPSRGSSISKTTTARCAPTTPP